MSDTQLRNIVEAALLAEITLRHCPCAFCQRQNRLNKAAGKIQSHYQSQENRQQCRY